MKVGILGRNGFIGGALAKRFDTVYNYPRKDLDYIFWFAAPSSQVLFNQAEDYCHNETVDGFKNIIRFCAEHKIKLIYPSSATIYESEDTYAKTKKELEYLQENSKYKNVLGLRIFCGYGVGEDHKGEYASIVYQFCKQMKAGKQPIIYGDGSQTRDFIYIEDIVDNIIQNMDKTGVIDLGTGVHHSFTEVVEVINDELKTNIKPFHIHKPPFYIEKSKCENPVPCKYSLREGVKEILNSIM